MWEKYKKIIIVVLVVVLIFLIWAIFIRPEPVAEDLIVSKQSEESSNIDEKIIRSLNKVNSLKLKELSDTLFANPILTELVDYNRPIKINRVGRSNPFEPIGKGSSAPILTPPTLPLAPAGLGS